jgi:hypothetical protein
MQQAKQENDQRSMKRQKANIEHRTPNIEYRMQQAKEENAQRPMRRQKANIEHRTPNTQHRMRECSCSSAFLLRRVDAGFENPDQFVCFF